MTDSPEAQHHAAATPAPGTLRILLVDDNQDAREMLGELLEVSGYTIQLAGDGPSALAALDAFTPQVAILDIGLPGMDGYELARELRRRVTSPLHLIAVTGYGLASDRDRSRDAGFDEHLVKPVDAAELMARLATFAGA